MGLEVVMSGDGPITRTYKQVIDKFSTLGKEIKISPKANICINEPGFRTEFFVETVNVVVGIGTDHTADIIMTKDAWEALKNGEEVTITTHKQFKKEFL
jgi:hypothetical protein